MLIDEVLTPDSSRFWPAKSYQVGRSQESFDKQYLRGEPHRDEYEKALANVLLDWLTAEGLKGKEGVEVPEDVVLKTREKYQSVYNQLF